MGGAYIKISPCGEKLCGQIVWLRSPFDEDGREVRGVQDRKMLGLEILSGFEPSLKQKGAWTGTIYNPENGKTYRGILKLDPDGQLLVRGYIGIPLLGGTTAWTRLPSEGPQTP